MATVTHFTPSISVNLVCCKGQLHNEQPLNLVCLDPLCRTSPLSCSICFSQIHKYHKVVGLNKFMDDYRRNVGSSNKNMLQKKITKGYNSLKDHLHKFKDYIIHQINNFEKAIDKYAEHLSGQSHIRNCVGQQLNVQLQPQKITNLRSQADLQRSLRFILNNCLYDSNLNMINASQILKQNEDRVCALLDKMVYMTQFCQKLIKQALSSLNFAKNTLKLQKIQIDGKINKLMDAESDPTQLKYYMQQKNNLKKLIEQTSSLILEQSQKVQYMHQWDNLPQDHPNYLFGKYRNKNLELKNNGASLKSNINSDKPQYGLAWPNINLQPLKVKQWSIKINKCRDFSSENTMAVGIAKLSDMKLADYKGKPTNCLLVSSQGYVSLNNNSEKSNFVYRQGDTIHFKYDPFYGTLEISKQNGRKLTLRGLGSEEPVYACVRFTYSSDQVQLI